MVSELADSLANCMLLAPAATVQIDLKDSCSLRGSLLCTLLACELGCAPRCSNGETGCTCTARTAKAALTTTAQVLLSCVLNASNVASTVELHPAVVQMGLRALRESPVHLAVTPVTAAARLRNLLSLT